jgi:hypothetical protein
MGFAPKSQASFQQQVLGTWGVFQTPSGSVHFLDTKARIGSTAKDLEKRLTTFLRPVREILPTANMDFNQLLQRDLDDHRVATNLVPYILDANVSGPAFFPPIVAAILPFEGTTPVAHFPKRQHVARYQDRVPWEGYRFGNAFQFDRLQDPDNNEDDDIKLGRLKWNPEEARFVVIDGQHRAMALLAIDRTINNTWNESGAQYRYFYEYEIERILSGKTPEERQQIFKNIEYPVCLVWFPDQNEDKGDQHQAARRLFVDVNKNARTPSESRLVLLSDTELLSIFTRQILNRFRVLTTTVPIFCVEYDHPGNDQAAYSKWSVISNVITIRECVNRALFGPSKYIDNVASNFGGRESEFERNQFMRDTLQVKDGISEVEDGVERQEIGNTLFPRSKLEFLCNQLMVGWGGFIVQMLSDLLPYKVHADALKELKKNWATPDSKAQLADSAIFEGVGMFWTIRDSYQYWERQNAVRAEFNKGKIEKTDIVKTWDVLEIKKAEFESLRAKSYLGKDTPEAVREANAAFSGFSTNACQVGFLLTARTLAAKATITMSELPAFGAALIGAANLALSGGPKVRHGRRTVFWNQHQDALNRIPKLDSPFSVYFRYFWLELLCAKEAIGQLDNWVKPDLLQELRDLARRHYLEFLIKDQAKSLKRLNPTWADKAVKEKAAEGASEVLRKALSAWFNITKPTYEAWHDNLSAVDVNVIDPEDVSPEAEAMTDASIVDSEAVQDVPFDDLLKAPPGSSEG